MKEMVCPYDTREKQAAACAWYEPNEQGWCRFNCDHGKAAVGTTDRCVSPERAAEVTTDAP